MSALSANTMKYYFTVCCRHVFKIVVHQQAATAVLFTFIRIIGNRTIHHCCRTTLRCGKYSSSFEERPDTKQSLPVVRFQQEDFFHLNIKDRSDL